MVRAVDYLLTGRNRLWWWMVTLGSRPECNSKAVACRRIQGLVVDFSRKQGVTVCDNMIDRTDSSNQKDEREEKDRLRSVGEESNSGVSLVLVC